MNFIEDRFRGASAPTFMGDLARGAATWSRRSGKRGEFTVREDVAERLGPLDHQPPLTTGGTRPTAGARGSGLPGLARPAWCSTWAAHTWTLRPIFIGRYLAISILVEFLQRFTGLGDFVGVNGSVLVQVERFEKRVHHALAAHAAGTETGSTWPSRTTGTTGSAWATWAAFARGRTLIAILGHEEAR